MKMFYRFHDRSAAPSTFVDLYEFVSIKETVEGHWIVPKEVYEYGLAVVEHIDGMTKEDYYKKHKKWVSLSARKRYAYPSKIEAIENFLARKNRQLGFLRQKLKSVNDAIITGLKDKEKLINEIYPKDYFVKESNEREERVY